MTSLYHTYIEKNYLPLERKTLKLLKTIYTFFSSKLIFSDFLTSEQVSLASVKTKKRTDLFLGVVVQVVAW